MDGATAILYVQCGPAASSQRRSYSLIRISISTPCSALLCSAPLQANGGVGLGVLPVGGTRSQESDHRKARSGKRGHRKASHGPRFPVTLFLSSAVSVQSLLSKQHLYGPKLEVECRVAGARRGSPFE